jgi:hypothetical protein
MGHRLGQPAAIACPIRTDPESVNANLTDLLFSLHHPDFRTEGTMSQGVDGKRRRAVSDWAVETLEGRVLLSHAGQSVATAPASEVASMPLVPTAMSLQASTQAKGLQASVTLVATVHTARNVHVVRAGRVRFSVLTPTSENLGAAHPDRLGQATLVTSRLALGGTYQVLAQYVSPDGRYAPSSANLSFTVGEPVVASLLITAPQYFGAPGSLVTFSVTALDRAGQPVTDYTGTINVFSPTDHSAQFVPHTYNFTTADHGTHEFADGVTFHKGGAEVLKVDQISNTRIAGSQKFGIE